MPWKLPPNGDGTSKFQAVIEPLDHLQDLSHQVVDEFSGISGSVDMYKVHNQKSCTCSGRAETEAGQTRGSEDNVGDVHANIEQDIESLSSQREAIVRGS